MDAGNIIFCVCMCVSLSFQADRSHVPGSVLLFVMFYFLFFVIVVVFYGVLVFFLFFRLKNLVLGE